MKEGLINYSEFYNQYGEIGFNNKKFVMGIKWHPELMLNEQYVDEIFKMFIDSSKEKEDM